MLKRIISAVIAFSFIAGVTIVIVVYSRGYRLDTQQKNLTTTGILSVSSFPEKASIYIDGKLTSASNASITLPPGWYNIRISKEGYQSWEKKVRIQGEVVSQIDALLIPGNPSLRALTVNGISLPMLSPSGTKIAYVILPKEASTGGTLAKSGVWMLELRTGPLGGKIEPKQVFSPIREYDYNSANLTWSPDEKKIILSFLAKDKKKETVISALQLSLDTENVPPTEVLPVLPTIRSQWEETKQEENRIFLSSLPLEVSQFLREKTAFAKPSPDETKILYLATASAQLATVITPALIGSNSTAEIRTVQPNKYYVYDQKEDKNYFITDQKDVIKQGTLPWYADSKHIVMIEKDTIYIIDYDGTNRRPVYSGPFEDNLVFTWPPGGQLVILTNLNQPQLLSNFYALDLR